MDRPARASARIEVSSDLANLSPIRAFVRSFCHRRIGTGIQEDVIHRLELAVSEAAANIMKHAYGGNSEEQLKVEAAAYDDCVIVTLKDKGIPFNPDSQSVHSPSVMKSGGMGLYIINSCVDRADYSRSDDGQNEIRLTTQFAR